MQDRPTLFLEVIQRRNHQVREREGGGWGREREGGGVRCGGGVPDEECTVLLLRMDRLSIGARGQLAIKLKQLQLIVVNSGARTFQPLKRSKPVSFQSEGVKKARVTKS